MSVNIVKRLDSINSLQQKLDLKKLILIEKGMNSDNPSEILKAAATLRDIEGREGGDRKSYVIDPYAFEAQAGYKDKPTSLSYSLLRAMAKTPIVNAVIRTRINQVAAFCEPQKDRYSTGYVIRKKKLAGGQNTDKLTKQEEQEIYELTEFIENCGMDNNWEADDFDTFMRKWMKDCLELDQGTFEPVRNRFGLITNFLATDGATFRIAESYDDESYKNELNKKMKQKIQGYFPSYVQVYQTQAVNDFYPWELCFATRNPSTNVNSNGYGVSEIEDMISVITSMLWGDEYNRRFFKQGSAPKGILKVAGSMNEGKLAEFRQQWMATMRGVYNSWKTPILEADKVEWVDLQKSNQDMEFSKWQEYLIKLVCALYTIDPSEVNFPLQGSSNAQPMFEGNNEARVKYSKDRGLYPLLKFAQRRLNKHIIRPYSMNNLKYKFQKYEFSFIGLDALTQKDELEMDIKAMAFSKLNEIRTKRGLEDVEFGDLILNPTYMQAKQMEIQEKQQEMFSQQQSNEQGQYPNEEEGGGETQKAITNENPISDAFNDWFEKFNHKE